MSCYPLVVLIALLLVPHLLVPRLGSKRYRVREAAHRSLALMDATARTALEARTRHSDREVRRRVADILADLETMAGVEWRWSK